MSKSSRSTTPILCLDADLSAAVDAILLRMKGRTPSKAELLNVLSANLCGDKHDWGFIKKADKPVVSKRASGQVDAFLDAMSTAQEEAEADAFTQHCIEVAHSAFIYVAETDTDITDADGDGLFEEGEINAACLEAAQDFISANYGNPVGDHSRGEIQQFGMEQSITKIIIDSDWDRLIDILDINGRSQARDEADLAEGQEQQDRDEQDQNLIDQELAEERTCVEPKAPGTLGEPGRNPGGFLPSKTKVLGYQVYSFTHRNYWGGRDASEVLSAPVAEADMAMAKDMRRDDDYVIIRVVKGDVENPKFID